jgi:hypothetical protein
VPIDPFCRVIVVMGAVVGVEVGVLVSVGVGVCVGVFVGVLVDVVVGVLVRVGVLVGVGVIVGIRNSTWVPSGLHASVAFTVTKPVVPSPVSTVVATPLSVVEVGGSTVPAVVVQVMTCPSGTV